MRPRWSGSPGTSGAGAQRKEATRASAWGQRPAGKQAPGAPCMLLQEGPSCSAGWGRWVRGCPPPPGGRQADGRAKHLEGRGARGLSWAMLPTQTGEPQRSPVLPSWAPPRPPVGSSLGFPGFPSFCRRAALTTSPTDWAGGRLSGARWPQGGLSCCSDGTRSLLRWEWHRGGLPPGRRQEQRFPPRPRSCPPRPFLSKPTHGQCSWPAPSCQTHRESTRDREHPGQ